MLQPVAIVLFILVASQGQRPVSSQDVSVHLCTYNKTYALKIKEGPSGEPSCQCQIDRTSGDPQARNDYIHTPGVGSHKMHTDAKNWNDARNVCKQEGAHLAIINSKAEEKILLDIFSKNAASIKNGVNQDQALLGIHDLFKEGEWLTIFDEPLKSTGYAEWSSSWWGPQPDNKDNNQNCGALVLKGGLDDIHCHETFAFFCEAPLACAG